MKTRQLASLLLTFFTALYILTVPVPQLGHAQTTSTASVSGGDIQSRLLQIEAKTEKRRKALGIPGMSLAIVKDGKVIYSKGLGYKDLAKKVPVTADTQFAIGSATKAFTGLSVLLSQDDGKLSLDESPKKYLSYFKINDPKIDEKIQVRDLLIHSSGLNRTDLGWITGKLDTDEIIKVAGNAKPMAGLRERFFYQNVMFLTAGEIVAAVQNKPWTEFVPERIFRPLGMTNSTMSVKQMKKADDYSFGYEHNFDTKKTRRLPTRDISAIAPAGSINSSSNDMAKWLRFLLNKGEINGKALVTKKGFDEWIKPHMKITPNGNVGYGFGWFVQDWKGKKVIQHGGNIDGFNSMVAVMPEENLGFVMLTNVSASSLGGELMQIVWSGMLDDLNTKPLSDQAKKEVGKYKFPQAGFDIDVKIEDGKLVAKVPGQPTYILENVKERRYKLSNAPSGFFITFRDNEAFLEQPQGSFTLPKAGAPAKTSKSENSASNNKAENAILGTYRLDQPPNYSITVLRKEGNLFLQVPNQPQYLLREKEKDIYFSPTVPDVLRRIEVKRDSKGNVTELISDEPGGKFSFKKITVEKPKISASDLMAKMISALGGEENQRKVKSRVSTFRLNAIHQGITGYGKAYAKAPNKSSSRTTLTALGKKIGWINDFFDGTKGGQTLSFGEDDLYTGERLKDVKVANDFYPFVGWENKLEKVEIARMGKVRNKDVYVVSIKPKNANRFALYVSTKTFLPLRRTSVIVSSTSSRKVPSNQYYEDYREVDGIMMPFKVTTSNIGMGDMIMYIQEIKHNVKISDKRFRMK